MSAAPTTDGQGVERFVGFRFPDGRYRIDAEKHALWLRAVDGTPSKDGLAHPAFHFIAAHSGMGYTFPQFMELLQAPLEAGALFGEEDLHIIRPLRLGEEVAVRASIVAAHSKNGKSGRFDVVTCGIELIDADGALACTSRETYIIPRGRA